MKPRLVLALVISFALQVSAVDIAVGVVAVPDCLISGPDATSPDTRVDYYNPTDKGLYFWEITSGDATIVNDFGWHFRLQADNEPSVEGFETGDFTTFDWEHDGDSSWSVTGVEANSGSFSAQAGEIDDDGTSTLRLISEYSDGDISFFVKTSSEARFDELIFKIDSSEVDDWSGEVDWTQVTYPISAGVHTFEWSYVKDNSVSEGMDSAWLDDIHFPVESIAEPNNQDQISIYEYYLPIVRSDARAFFTHQNTLFVLDYPNRTLYRTEDVRLLKAEDMKGWYILDAIWFGDRPLYCSRNRVLYRLDGEVYVVPIEGANTLTSITTDGNQLFLLEQSVNEIFVLGSDYDVMRHIKCATRRPIDIVYHKGFLWLLDLSDRCIHKIDIETGQFLLKIQAGLRGGSNGLVFIDDNLYVHDEETSSLRLVRWTQEDDVVLSCEHPVCFQFVQDSWNDSQTNTCLVTFRVSQPPLLRHQILNDLQWSETPTFLTTDRFGQALAIFEDIQILPKGYHRLSYVTEAHLSAIQYQLPELDLTSLDLIPTEIASTYLANEEIYSMESDNIVMAAGASRNDPNGNRPQNVRELIENIVTFTIEHMSYVLESGWDNADVVLDRGNGSCSEYCFLFSALCRLNGIPTRLVGGIGLKDPGITDGFHRWTDIWYPTVGWVPVDVTKIDSGNPGSYDYEFLFGLPGYMMTFSVVGGNDADGLGLGYFIWRRYVGGQRRRDNYVENLTELDNEKYPTVVLELE